MSLIEAVKHKVRSGNGLLVFSKSCLGFLAVFCGQTHQSGQATRRRLNAAVIWRSVCLSSVLRAGRPLCHSLTAPWNCWLLNGWQRYTTTQTNRLVWQIRSRDLPSCSHSSSLAWLAVTKSFRAVIWPTVALQCAHGHKRVSCNAACFKVLLLSCSTSSRSNSESACNELPAAACSNKCTVAKVPDAAGPLLISHIQTTVSVTCQGKVLAGPQDTGGETTSPGALQLFCAGCLGAAHIQHVLLSNRHGMLHRLCQHSTPRQAIVRAA